VTVANFTCLAAARHAVLQKAGWNVEGEGLFGAPAVTVVVGEEVHATVFKALALLGLGKNRVVRAPVDGQGIRTDSLPRIQGPTIICAQAGNVNTGAFDPFKHICQWAHDAGAWVHVDGAFGLWAAASKQYEHLVSGAAAADSWAVDAHKWLNVPQDSGIAIVRNPDDLKAAMAISAAYLNLRQRRDPMQWVPESSRRARGIEIWTALRSLGRKGLANLIERNCHYAQFAAERLQVEGFAVLNDVVLNQVLVSFGDANMTQRVIDGVQQDGTCWCGGTVWQGQTAQNWFYPCRIVASRTDESHSFVRGHLLFIDLASTDEFNKCLDDWLSPYKALPFLKISSRFTEPIRTARLGLDPPDSHASPATLPQSTLRRLVLAEPQKRPWDLTASHQTESWRADA